MKNKDFEEWFEEENQKGNIAYSDKEHYERCWNAAINSLNHIDDYLNHEVDPPGCFQ